MPDQETPSLGGSAFASGIGWKLTTQVVTQTTRAGVAIILARLLSPFEFGVAGLVLVFAPLAYIFTDLGAILIQQRDQTEDDRSTAFWLSIAIGSALTLIGLAAAGPIANFFDEPEVKNLFMVLSCTFVLTASTTTHSALLHRAIAFRRVESANMAAVIGGSAVGIAVAFLGGGAWAIVLQQVATSVVLLVLLWVVSPWRPTRRFSRASVRALWSFTAHNSGANVLHYFESNIDNILVGRFLGPASLGIYSLSYNLMLYPVTRLASPIHEVLFPLLSRVQDDTARVNRMWLRVTRAVATIASPAMVGLIVVAPELVGVLLGSKWDAAVPVIQILAFAGLVYAVRLTSTTVLLAKGQARTLFWFGLASATIFVTGFAVAVSWGVEAVAISFTASIVVTSPVLIALATRAVGMSTRTYVSNLTGVAVSTAVMAAMIVSLRALLVREEVRPVFVLIVVCLAGAVVYIPLCLRLVPDMAAELRQVVRVIRTKRTKPAA